MTQRITRGVDLTFYQIAPGYEGTIAQHFVPWDAADGRPKRAFFKALGRFDLVVVEEMDEAGSGPDAARERLLLSDYVLSAHTTMGTTWAAAGLPELWEMVDQLPLVGIGFLKLSPHLLARFGADLIDRFIAAVAAEPRWADGRRPRPAVYGTVGYNELIVFCFADLASGFEPMLADMFWLRSLRTCDLGLPGEESLLVDTHTIPGIDYRELQRIRAGAGEPADHPEAAPATGATISVATVAGAEDDVAKQLALYVGDPVAVLGEYDLRVTATLTVPQALKAVLDLRDRLNNSIIATSTDLGFARPPSRSAAPSKPTYEDVEMGADIEGFLRANTLLYQNAISLLGAINSRLARSDLADAYADLSPFVRAFVTNDYGDRDIDDRDVSRLWKLVELLATGFRQRSCGVMLSPYVSADVAVGFKGSATAIFRAAGAVPFGMLRALGARWCGFVVAGQSDEHYRYDFGIMNLPIRCMFDPSRWWGLLHETGHELAWQRRITKRDRQVDGIRQGLVARFSSVVDELSVERDMWERYADLASFAFGFARDWPLFAGAVMPYLLRGYPDVMDDHIGRMAGVWYCYHRYWEGSSRTSLNDSSVGPLAEAFLAEVERACGWKFKSEDRLKRTSELESHLNTWQPYLDYAAEDLEEIMPKRAWTPGSTPGIDLILDGRVADGLDDPAALILELLHHRRQVGEEKWNSEGFPVRMAAIQSLNLYFLRQTDEIPLVRLRARQE